MKSALFITAFLLAQLFGVTTSRAQSKKIDSISVLLKNAQDTVRVNLLLEQGELVRGYDKNKSIQLFDQVIAEAKAIGFVKGEINGLHQKAISYGMTGDYRESLNYLRQGVKLAQKDGDMERLSQVYKTSGLVYKRIGDYTTSFDYYLKSLHLVDSLGFKNSSLHINIGILYDLMEKEDKAIEHFEKSIIVATDDTRESVENSVLANLAVIDLGKGAYDAALKKLLRRANYAEQQKDNWALCSTYLSIGKCYLKMEKWELSQKYLEKALKYAKQLSLEPKVALYYYYLADLMLQQGRYQEANFNISKNLEILEGINEYSLFKKSHELAYQINQEANRLPTAIHHLNMTMAYGDSLLNETKIKEIQKLQIIHDVNLKDKELKENELELTLLNTQVASNQKRLIYLLIITLLLFATAASFYLQFRNKKKSYTVLEEKNYLISKQNELIESINSELEKRMLRAQMNPHFIFNSLNSIQYLITSNDRVSALKYLTKFSKLLRQVLESSINVNLVLREEIELLKIYLELESLRFDNSFKYNIHIDEKLDIEEHELPMLLVQPYIENAIIHGLMPKEGDKVLTISFKDIEDFIICEIEDNGIGIQKGATKKRKKTSRGMAITAKRITALKKYTNQELLKIENLNKGDKTGTCVTILIPKLGVHQNILPKQAV